MEKILIPPKPKMVFMNDIEKIVKFDTYNNYFDISYKNTPFHNHGYNGDFNFVLNIRPDFDSIWILYPKDCDHPMNDDLLRGRFNINSNRFAILQKALTFIEEVYFEKLLEELQ